MPKDVKCWTKPKVAGGTYTTCVDKEGVQLRKKIHIDTSDAKKGKATKKPAKKPTMPKVIPAKPRKPKKPIIFNVAKPKPAKKPTMPTVIPAKKPRVPLIPKVIPATASLATPTVPTVEEKEPRVPFNFQRERDREKTHIIYGARGDGNEIIFYIGKKGGKKIGTGQPLPQSKSFFVKILRDSSGSDMYKKGETFYATPKAGMVLPPKPKPDAQQMPPSLPIEKITNAVEVSGDLLKFYKGSPVSFECYARMSFYLFLEVMKRNKNDCIIGLDKIQGYTQRYELDKEGNFGFVKKPIGWHRDSGYYVSLEQLRSEDMKSIFMEKYEECAKNNKIFCMPIFKSNHANMLVFNHHLNLLEYYEPHGTATAPFTNAVKNIVKYFNSNGASGSFAKKIKFSGSDETCPSYSKEIREEWEKMGLRVREIRRIRKGKKILDPSEHGEKSGLQILDAPTKEQEAQRGRTPRGKTIKDVGGYCCMWSFLHMDYRLKHPNLPPNQLAQKLVELGRENPKEFFRNYIRGYTDDVFQNLVDKIGADMLYEVNKANKSAISKFNEVINKMWLDATGKKLY